MSVLDTNFDSPREMPSRAAWLDNASAQLLNDNSYFNAAPSAAEPAWLGKVDLFDSSRQPAAYEDAPAGDPVPVPKEPTPDVPPEPPHTPEEKPGVPIVLVPAGEPPPDGPRLADNVPEGLPSVEDLLNEYENSVASQVAPQRDPEVAPEPAPAPEPTPEPDTAGPRPPSKRPESDNDTEPSEPLPPIGPRAVEGPPPPGTAVPAGIPGNGPPEHTGPSLPYTSRAEKREWEAKQRAELIAQQQAAAAAAAANDPGPGPDGRNADGTYGAGHHPYTPAPDRDTRSTEEMTKYYEEMHKKRMEEPAPYVAPRPNREAVLKALIAAVNRDKDTPTPKPTTGEIAHADPNYVPPAGAFGGLRGRRGG